MGKGTWVLYQRPGLTAVIPLCGLARQGSWQVPGWWLCSLLKEWSHP